MDIIAYTFDADIFCVPCTQERFARRPPLRDIRENLGYGYSEYLSDGSTIELDEHLVPVDERDSDGNLIHPTFAGSLEVDCPPSCGDCHEYIEGASATSEGLSEYRESWLHYEKEMDTDCGAVRAICEEVAPECFAAVRDVWSKVEFDPLDALREYEMTLYVYSDGMWVIDHPQYLQNHNYVAQAPIAEYKDARELEWELANSI
jgi:hypothetical protein